MLRGGKGGGGGKEAGVSAKGKMRSARRRGARGGGEVEEKGEGGEGKGGRRKTGGGEVERGGEVRLSTGCEGLD